MKHKKTIHLSCLAFLAGLMISFNSANSANKSSQSSSSSNNGVQNNSTDSGGLSQSDMPNIKTNAPDAVSASSNYENQAGANQPIINISINNTNTQSQVQDQNQKQKNEANLSQDARAIASGQGSESDLLNDANKITNSMSFKKNAHAGKLGKVVSFSSRLGSGLFLPAKVVSVSNGFDDDDDDDDDKDDDDDDLSEDANLNNTALYSDFIDAQMLSYKANFDVDLGINMYGGSDRNFYSSLRIMWSSMLQSEKYEDEGKLLAWNADLNSHFGYSLKFKKGGMMNTYGILGFTSLYGNKLLTSPSVYESDDDFDLNFGLNAGAGISVQPSKVPVGLYVDVTVPVYFNAKLISSEDQEASVNFIMPKLSAGLQFGF